MIVYTATKQQFVDDVRLRQKAGPAPRFSPLLGNLGRIVLKVPGVQEQETIYEKLDSVEEKIISKIKLKEKYMGIKKGLMQNFVTVKVKV